MVNFALDYICLNKDKYDDKIVISNSYTYTDMYNNKLSTDEYINLDTIYYITNKYFGKKYFTILNDNVSIIDNYVTLSCNKFVKPVLDIKTINVKEADGNIIATLSYENDENIKYIYTFRNVNGILRITNVEVEA